MGGRGVGSGSESAVIGPDDLLTRARDGVRALLILAGRDPTDEAVRDTPDRVVRAWMEMTSGTAVDVAKVLARQFAAGEYDEVVCLRDIEFVSVCEHHLLPFTGRAAVAYLPGGEAGAHRVVGLSKLARLVDAYARRPQLQERMTAQIADTLVEHLHPRGVAVLVEAEHACMTCRGVGKRAARMGTSVMRGVFRDKPEARAEVLALLRGVS